MMSMEIILFSICFLHFYPEKPFGYQNIFVLWRSIRTGLPVLYWWIEESNVIFDFSERNFTVELSFFLLAKMRKLSHRSSCALLESILCDRKYGSKSEFGTRSWICRFLISVVDIHKCYVWETISIFTPAAPWLSCIFWLFTLRGLETNPKTDKFCKISLRQIYDEYVSNTDVLNDTTNTLFLRKAFDHFRAKRETQIRETDPYQNVFSVCSEYRFLDSPIRSRTQRARLRLHDRQRLLFQLID